MQLYNIHNFEAGEAPRTLNSPRSLEACLRAGLDPSELLRVDRADFDEKGLSEKMCDMKFNAFERKRLEKIKMVKRERESIITYMKKTHSGPGSPSATNGAEQTGKKSSLVEIEEKRMEALKKRQKDEMNKLIEKEKALVLLQQKIAHTEAEEVKKKKLHDKKVAEQKAQAARKAQQIAADIAAKEQEEAEMRKQLDRKEQEHSKKIQIERAQMEKRILKEARERDMERAAKAEAHRLQTEALADAQFQLAEKNRQIMMEREQRVQQQLLEKKHKKSLEIEQQRAEATKRMEEALLKHEQAQEKKKKDFHDREVAALERAKVHEKEKNEMLKKQAQDRENKNRNRFQRLVDAYGKRKQKREEIVKRRNEKDSTFGKLREARDDHVAMLKFTTDLTMAEKQENVERVARVNEFRRLQMLRKIEADEERYMKIKMDKKALRTKHMDEVKNTLIRKHDVATAMETMRATNDFSALDQLFAGKKKNNNGDDDERAQTAGNKQLNKTI